MSRKNKNRNYLTFVPSIVPELTWTHDENEKIIILIENKGMMKYLTQKYMNRPRISQIHLEQYGSFIWHQIDGKKTVLEIANLAESQFGEEIYPLYERISSYINTLKNAGFLTMDAP